MGSGDKGLGLEYRYRTIVEGGGEGSGVGGRGHEPPPRTIVEGVHGVDPIGGGDEVE